MRLVLDTSVVVAGLRNRHGASNELLDAAFARKFEWLVSNPLLLEYEAVLNRDSQRTVTAMSRADVEAFLEAVRIAMVPVQLGYHRRPLSPDPDDEHVVDLCLRSRTDALVTFNRRDFARVLPPRGVALYSPGEMIEHPRRA